VEGNPFPGYVICFEASSDDESCFSFIIYNKPTRCNSGSIVFINNYKYALHGIVQCTTDLEHLYRIYSISTHDKYQWLLLQFIELLMMDTKGVRNM